MISGIVPCFRCFTIRLKDPAINLKTFQSYLLAPRNFFVRTELLTFAEVQEGVRGTYSLFEEACMTFTANPDGCALESFEGNYLGIWIRKIKTHILPLILSEISKILTLFKK